MPIHLFFTLLRLLKTKGPLNYLSDPKLQYLNHTSYTAQQTAEVRLVRSPPYPRRRLRCVLILFNAKFPCSSESAESQVFAGGG